MTFADIHSHVLPGVDDGAADLDQSMAILEQQSEAGTRVIFATPHVIDQVDLVRAMTFADLLEQVNTRAKQMGIDIQVLPGAEVYPSSVLGEAVKKGIPVTLGGHGQHILVDVPMSNLPSNFTDMLFNLRSAGITPIIAHPERNGQLQNDIDLINFLVQSGYLLQVNAGSLIGRNGPMAQEIGRLLIKSQVASFVAGDTHRVTAQPYMPKAFLIVANRAGEEYAEQIMLRNGMEVANGQRVIACENYVEVAKESFFGRLFGRKRA